LHRPPPITLAQDGIVCTVGCGERANDFDLKRPVNLPFAAPADIALGRVP